MRMPARQTCFAVFFKSTSSYSSAIIINCSYYRIGTCNVLQMRFLLKSEGVDMRIAKFLEIGALVVVGTLFMNSIALFAEKGNSQNSIMLQPVRLSYSSSWVPAGEKSSPKIRLSVWPDGHYRILRADYKGQSQLRQGIVPARQLKQLRWLLEAPDFQALSGSHGGLLRGGSESFVAEIPRGGAVQHMARSEEHTSELQ